MQNESVRQRQTQSLYHSLGPLIGEALTQPDVVEVMANPDGTLWIDRHGTGREKIGTIDPVSVEATIRLLAGHMGLTVNRDHPAVSGTLPRSGERFQGVLPPLTEHPTFSIRRRASIIYTLDDYIQQQIITPDQAQQLRDAIIQRKNILVAGGTGSGKTTFANALLAEPAFTNDRIVIIEDTRELQCSAPDKVELLTKSDEPKVTMNDLLRISLRLRPDRIIVGEVRGGEALALVKAWNTGHPGGIATIHANSATDAIQRLEDLIGEASQIVPRRSIESAIQLIFFIERTSNSPSRKITIVANDSVDAIK